MQGELLSDLLNEKKICQLFHEEQQQPENKKEQISLNFTVTSRQNNTANRLQLGSNSFFQQAKDSLNQFETWCTKKLDTQNKEIIDKFADIQELTQKKKSMIISMPPLQILKQNRKNERKSFGREQCEKCLQKESAIESLKKQLSLAEEKIIKNSLADLRFELLDQVQTNLLKEKNEELMLEINHLKDNIQKTNLEKSTLFDKTKDLQKRLGCLQKSFSNAKNSTNPTNPNDTMNRGDSLISFDNFQTTVDDEIRYLERLKEKYLNFVNEEIKEKLEASSNYNISKEEQMQLRKSSFYYPVYQGIRGLIQKLKLTKKPKQNESKSLIHSFNQDSVENINKPNEQRNLKIKISSLQNSNSNLRNANNDLKILLEESVKKNQEIEQIKNKEIQKIIEQMEEKVRKIKLTTKRMLSEEKNKLKHYSEYIQRLQHEKNELTYELQDLKGSIRVYCRIRPRFGSQLKSMSTIQNNQSAISFRDSKKYQFSHVFGEKTTQYDVFKETSRLVDCAFEGRNLCIFAYGQTGSGKTYTLHGTETEPGLTPNIIKQIFSISQEKKENYEVIISMGMIEIYLENLIDLNGVVPLGTKIQIKEDKNVGIFLEHCPLITFDTVQQMIEVYKDGIDKRKKRETEKNEQSSRSHCITIIHIEKENRRTKEKKYSKITLIDLAGTEKNTSSNPIIARQTNFINTSLSSLATVISAMKNKEHVPYRNCKLTHILKDSLTSKGKILMFINVSPAENSMLETERSLEFGKRVQKVERYEENDNKKSDKEREKEKSRRGSSKLSIS